MMPDTGLLVAFAVFVGTVIALFLVARFIVLWYWRIDEICDYLASIDESLKALPAVRQARAAKYRQKGAA